MSTTYVVKVNVVSDSLNKMGERKFFVGGNWKMNGSKAMIDELSGMLNEKCAGKETEVVVGVPSAYLMYTRDKVDKSVGVAAQNCYKAEKGAFTGMYCVSFPPKKVASEESDFFS